MEKKKMSHEEIMATIRRITEEAIARNKDKEYKITETSQSCDEEINTILREANTARKRDYRVYEGFKARISRTGCDYKQYEQSVRELSRILAV